MTEPNPKHLLEALLFSAEEPVEEKDLQAQIGAQVALAPLLSELQADYGSRGVHLERQGRAWAFRTAPELAPHLRRTRLLPRKLSRAALETLAIIAYQQPVTRAEIEAVRGVAVGQGTLDILVEAGWVAPKGRREAPGRPVTWVTTPAFLDHFALQSVDDLPRLEELEGASLFNPTGDR
jgi:segregation and condensation protein B